MGVYIKGLEMPISCTDCPMMQDEWVSCKLTGSWKWADEFTPSKERLKDCPLVTVPPHGRLIDADALREGLVSNHEVVIYAKSAPTIIPEDKEAVDT